MPRFVFRDKSEDNLEVRDSRNKEAFSIGRLISRFLIRTAIYLTVSVMAFRGMLFQKYLIDGISPYTFLGALDATLIALFVCLLWISRRFM